MSTLRNAIAAEKYDPAVVLGAIAESAQALTGASSAALAMRRDGLVICRARSGEMAPEVGSRLSVDSGISGECLRTGKVLRCDDTQKDYRADPEVCRRLGLRSIAAIPLRGQRGTMGVLEAFSTRPYAFAEEHMEYLIRLADLAEAARLRESGSVEARPSPIETSTSQPQRRAAASSSALLWAKNAISVQVRDRFSLRRVRIVLAALAVPLLALLGFSGWSARHKPTAEAVAQPAVTQPRTSPPSMPPATAAGADLVWKPSPAHVDVSQRTPNPGIEPAAKREIDQAPAAPPPSSSRDMSTTTETVAESSPLPPIAPPGIATPVEAPKLEALAPDKGRLATLASIPVEMPGFGSPVSQGLSGGVLEHKVQPIYPLQAMPMRLSGTVKLHATIGESGRVEEIKIVSGPPLLTAAAVDAVRQWRYSPFLLDGKPVKMQKDISVMFRAP
jgi:TonB family protein